MSFFHKYVFLTGAKLRNPSLWHHYDFLRSSEQWTFAQLKSEQEKRLQETFQFTINNSAFYRDYWSKSGEKLINDWSINRFQELPIVDKSHLLEKNHLVHCPLKLFKKTFYCETSGTTGEVLTFNRDENWDSFNRASIFRGYNWHGINPWDFNLYFWGYNTSTSKKIKMRFQDWLLNRYRIFDYSTEALRQVMHKLPKTHYIEGYSSMIYELAKEVNDADFITPKLKMIKGTSEKIYSHYQNTARKAFGMPIISEYGSAESGIIAFECPEGNMHVNMLGVYLEIENNNEIIVTNLVARSFPTVRYKLGDVVKLAPRDYECPCGLQHPVIQEVTGRIGKNILGKQQKYPSLTLYYIFKNLFFDHGIELNYQVHQRKVGELEVWIKEKLNDKTRTLLLQEFQKYFNNDILPAIIQKSNFRQQSGKLRDFVSYIE